MDRLVPVTISAVVDPLNNPIMHFTSDSSVTSKFICDAGEGPVTIDVESRAPELDFRRSVLSRAFTACMDRDWGLDCRDCGHHTSGTSKRLEDERRGVCFLALLHIFVKPRPSKDPRRGPESNKSSTSEILIHGRYYNCRT